MVSIQQMNTKRSIPKTTTTTTTTRANHQHLPLKPIMKATKKAVV
jgi:hypothetical protein